MIEYTIGNAVVTIDFDGFVRDELGGNRCQYTYTITANGWQYVGNDLHSGVASSPDEIDAAATLFGFLGACAESRTYNGGTGENADLFPDYVGEWAVENSDEIGMLEYELENNE